jgi:CRISPR-associated endonuclease Csn1
LHDQTVYGSNPWSRIALSSKISKTEIENICSHKLKEFIKEHIKQKGSIAKAFSDEELNKLQYNGKSLKEVEVNIPCYTQRIDIAKTFTDGQKTVSAKEKILKNVLDLQIRKVLQKRLDDFKGDFKKAFSNLDENPIWLNRGKGISIKRVTISGISNAESLHEKRDKDGNLILDENGKKQPVDFVNTGNNQHVAVYRDASGNLQENVVSFFEAVTRKNLEQPIIDKSYKASEGWQFLFSMKQNEYFVFPNEKTGFNPNEIDLLNPENYALISPNLFRGQKFSISGYKYVFRHHLETNVDVKKELDGIAYKQFSNLTFANAIIKVRVNHIGQIVSIGEY